MKKLITLGITAAFCCAISANAVTVNVSQLVAQGYNAGEGGGEFNVNPVSGTGYAASVLVNGGFETFCVAGAVGIAVPGTYNATVNAAGVYVNGFTAAVPPATGTIPTTRTIARGTAFLYSEFALGTLGGVNFYGNSVSYRYTALSGGAGSGRAADALQLQLAIWTLEGTYGYGSLAADLLNPWLNVAANQFGGGTSGLATAMLANTPGGFGVGTLDLTWAAGNPQGVAAGTPAQSMLTLLPDGGMTLGLLGMALTCLALVSRKVMA